MDTHILLWGLTDDRKLSSQGAKLLKDPDNEILVSAASLWEIAIKHRLGRIAVAPNLIIDACEKTGFCQLPITFEHCARLAELPLLHGDPFDRLLVAQSLSEPAMLITHDQALKSYGNTVLFV